MDLIRNIAVGRKPLVLPFARVLLMVALSSNASSASEFVLSNREDKETLMFTPKGSGKVNLTGKWEGSAKSIEVALFSPTQWIAYWRGTVTKNPFDLSWDFSEKELEESARPWKIVLRAKGGEAKGTVEVAGTAIEPGEGKEGEKEKKEETKLDKPYELSKPVKDEIPPIPLDDFGLRVRRIFMENPFYKPWVDKITSSKKNAKMEIRPLGLTVTPLVRKMNSRYGGMSLTVRNITLTPAQNVSLMESISGGVETSLELLMRVELPGWHLVALQLTPFTAYPGESPRITALQVETRSLSRGEVTPASAYPVSGTETVLLVPVLLSQPGEYLLTARPVAREPAEILFVLGSIELYRLSY